MVWSGSRQHHGTLAVSILLYSPEIEYFNKQRKRTQIQSFGSY